MPTQRQGLGLFFYCFFFLFRALQLRLAGLYFNHSQAKHSPHQPHEDTDMSQNPPIAYRMYRMLVWQVSVAGSVIGDVGFHEVGGDWVWRSLPVGHSREMEEWHVTRGEAAKRLVSLMS